MILTKQSTARTIVIGPILDADGVAKTDEVVASIKIHKNGGAAGALDGAATLTHSQTGFYRLALAAADFDTLGVAEFSLNSGTNSMPVKALNVITANAWDSLVGGTDTLESDITQLGGVAQSLTDLKDFADAGYDPATNKVEGVKLADTLTTYTGNTVQTGDSFARLGTPAGASVSADIAAVQADLPSKITKNVALANFPFIMILASDDITPATGLTVTATRSIDGAAFAACANAVTEIANGWYKISLAASDLNGDTIALRFTAATANDRNITIVTQAT